MSLNAKGTPKLTMLSTLGDYAMRFAEALAWLWKHHISTSSRFNSEGRDLKKHRSSHSSEPSPTTCSCIRFGVPVNTMKTTTDFFPAFFVLAVAATATTAPLPVDKSNQVYKRHCSLAPETLTMASAAVMVNTSSIEATAP
jgi:hypothetical protein